MKVTIKDNRKLVNNLKTLVSAYDFGKKLENLDITGNKEVTNFMVAPLVALAILFEKNSEEFQDEEWFQIIENGELDIDQKVNMLLALEETNIITEE